MAQDDVFLSEMQHEYSTTVEMKGTYFCVIQCNWMFQHERR